MGSRPVIAHHLIWTAYGWWLPNDPRGSMSKSIACDLIAELGQLHYGRKQLQPVSHAIRAFYNRAQRVLKHELLPLSSNDQTLVADAFAHTIEQHRYTCYACAIMPDHVHLLIRKRKHQAEQMIEHFQDSSRLRLRAANHRSSDHPVWGGPGWKVFFDHPDEIRRTIKYIEQNPIKIRLPAQSWEFVHDYDGWPLYAGHSPDSPYARGLRAVGRYPGNPGNPG